VLRDRDRFRRSLAVIRDNPALFARVMLQRMGQMLDYAGGGPAVVERVAHAAREEAPGASAGSGETGPEVDEPGDARKHDLERTERDARFLWPGRLSAGLRGVVRPVQQALLATLTPLVIAGVLVLLWLSWRPALLLFALPLYFLVTYSPFLYEWRVAVPMHYTLCAAAAATILLLLGALRAGADAVRGSRSAGGQNQAG
jgi:hypothetical protein